MPISSALAYQTALANITKACSTTISVPTLAAQSTWSLPATTSDSTCHGTTYTIQAGDTCESVSVKNHINSAALLQANGLPAYCAGFPKSGSICIPSAMQCTTYAPGIGETCDSIALRLGLTKPQLVSWNPEVDKLCGNIGKLASKHMVTCGSNPGGSWTDPSAGNDHPTSTVTPYTLVVTNSGSAFNLFPSATAQATLLPNEGYVTTFANASWENCDVYVTPPVVMDLANGTVSYACQDVVAAYGISMDELLMWNPGINTTGGFDSACELSFKFQYCVKPSLTLATDTVASCVFPALAQPGWTCGVLFAQRYNVSKAAVATWNPSVGTDCSKFTPGNTYCAAVEHYKSDGAISTCSYWSMANDTAPSSNPCGIFETKYKLDHSRFVAWNPSVKSDCSGIVRGYGYCVGTPSFHSGFP